MLKLFKVGFPQRYRRAKIDFKNFREARDFFSANRGKLALIHDRDWYGDGEYTCARLSEREPDDEKFYAQMILGNSLGMEFSVNYRSIDDILISGETIGLSIEMLSL